VRFQGMSLLAGVLLLAGAVAWAQPAALRPALKLSSGRKPGWSLWTPW